MLGYRKRQNKISYVILIALRVDLKYDEITIVKGNSEIKKQITK